MILRQRFKIKKHTCDDDKAKIQDKEANLRQYQDKNSKQRSMTKNNVKAKIQDKKVHLR